MNLLFLLLGLAAPATDDTDVPRRADTSESCGEDRSLAPLVAALDAAGEAAEGRNIDAFRPAWKEAVARMDCLEVIATPDIAASAHAADYLELAIEGDGLSMALALGAALSVPGGRPPSWLQVPESAGTTAEPSVVGVESPPRVALFIDGLPARSRPMNHAALYQAVGAGGEVLWSRWMQGDEALPEGFDEVSAPPPAQSGAALLQEVTGRLADGEYQTVLDIAIPAASAHPEYRDGFLAAADLAADQIRRSRLEPAAVGGFDPYAPRPRRGSLRRGDERKDFLLGFDAGIPSSIHGEWKLGRSAVDGIGLKIGAGAMLYGGSSLLTGVDSSLYLDWNLTPKWQLQTTLLGLFVDRSGSPYLNVGGAIQYDPPSPLEITVGLRAGPYNVVPTATVGFLW